MQDVRTLVTRYLGLSHLFTITKARWVHCVDAYNVVGNDVQNCRSVLKKPYNPRGVSNTKLHQLNKTRVTFEYNFHREFTRGCRCFQADKIRYM